MSIRNLVLALGGLIVTGAIILSVVLAKFTAELPELIGLADYKPLQLSEVYDRTGKKFGEFYREKRILIPYEGFPKHVVQAFVSAEDSSFFHHEGLNYLAMLRAFLANVKSKAEFYQTHLDRVSRSFAFCIDL